jgi:hypothetical protein
MTTTVKMTDMPEINVMGKIFRDRAEGELS